jgi:hypothetical protein
MTALTKIVYVNFRCTVDRIIHPSGWSAEYEYRLSNSLVFRTDGRGRG